MITVQARNERFAIPGHLTFVSGPGDLPLAEIQNEHASASVSLLGSHVLTYQPHGQEPVLWLSKQSQYRVGKAIRGGVPVIFPWFGAHPTDPDKPAHGFARTALWDVVNTTVLPGGLTQIALRYTDNEQTTALWPHPFELTVTVTVGAALTIELSVRNTGPENFTYTGALHSYFTVSDVRAVSIHGLDGRDYLDKAASYRRKTQQGPIRIAGYVDRIYLDTADTCEINDPGFGRSIVVEKSNSHSTVVWNPWIEWSASTSDFGDDEYVEMVCVETARAAEDAASVAPGETHRFSATLRVG